MLRISDCFENRLSAGNTAAGVTAWILLIAALSFLLRKREQPSFDSVFHSVQALELAAGCRNHLRSRSQHARWSPHERLAQAPAGLTAQEETWDYVSAVHPALTLPSGIVRRKYDCRENNEIVECSALHQNQHTALRRQFGRRAVPMF